MANLGVRILDLLQREGTESRAPKLRKVGWAAVKEFENTFKHEETKS